MRFEFSKLPRHERPMRTAGALIVLVILIAGCDDKSQTFGSSYDECLLKNLVHGEAALNLTRMEACQRHFETPAMSSVRMSAQATFKKNADETGEIEFRVTNSEPKKIVTAFSVTISFYKGTVEAKNLKRNFTWTFRRLIGPLEEQTFLGGLDAVTMRRLRNSLTDWLPANEGAERRAKRLMQGLPADDPLTEDPLMTSPFTVSVEADLQMSASH
jgi:hypothetical protein